MRHCIRFLILTLAFFALAGKLFPQEPGTNAGKKFTICFPKNYITDYPKELILYIYPESSDSAKVSVRYFKNVYVTNNYTTIRGNTLAIKLPLELELNDYDNPEKKVITIESDELVEVIALSKAYATSDATLCYPDKSADTMYVVSSYPNSLKINSNLGDNTNKYSSMAITPVLRKTHVKIIPSCPLNDNKKEHFGVMEFDLDTGETRMVKASIWDYYDLTGTVIESDAPIKVFAAHELTSMPQYRATDDYLLEEAPPVSLLGNEYILPALYSPSYNLKTLFRVVPAFDSTHLFMQKDTVLVNRLKFYEKNSLLSIYFTSDKPVLCAGYEFTTKNDTLFGDPFMTYIPSVNQYLDHYTFISAPHDSFMVHYVNVVIPKTDVASLLLDGSPIAKIDFTEDVAGTEYQSLNFQVSPGSHYIKADKPFGLIVYGYGNYDSYGYCGGMNAKRLLESIMDKTPPRIDFTDACSPFVTVMDTAQFSSGIDSVAVTDLDNVNELGLSGGEFVKSINFELINPLKDGSAVVWARDKAGNTDSLTIHIKGFDLTVDSLMLSDTVYSGDLVCRQIYVISNHHGNKFKLYFNGNIDFSSPSTWFENVMIGGDTITPTYCFTSDFSGFFADTLNIIDTCGRLYTFPFGYSVENRNMLFDTKCGAEVVFVRKEDSHKEIQKLEINMGTVYDLSGNQIFNFNNLSELNENMQNVAAGVYYAVINYDDNRLLVLKMMNYHE